MKAITPLVNRNFIQSPKIRISLHIRNGAALKALGAEDLQATGRWLNNRVENSLLPLRRRERAMLRFRRMRSLQKFAAVQCSVHDLFNQERHLSSRDILKLNRAAALDEWRQICAA